MRGLKLYVRLIGKETGHSAGVAAAARSGYDASP